MTLLCVPQFADPEADLVQLRLERHKALYDRASNLVFVDYDWQSSSLPSPHNLILSYHNYEETPADLESLLAIMKKRSPACLYKIATLATSTLDALRMLEFVQRHPNVIGLCMGEKGEATRILAPIVGTPIMYAPRTVEESDAPGQIPLSVLCNTYHFRKLHKGTPIYAVIGSPVSQSPGPFYHNAWMQGEGVYLRLHIEPTELVPFLSYAKRLPFRGLSVTLPHKEAILPLLDAVDPEAARIGAVNTVDVRAEKTIGYNTDGKGALQALGPVAGKKITILGAGGSARAIAYEAIREGALVTIANRTEGRAAQLAAQFGCRSGPLSVAQEPCDILINTIPNFDFASAATTVMDISLKAGHPDAKGMYVAQAELQREIWTQKTPCLFM